MKWIYTWKYIDKNSCIPLLFSILCLGNILPLISLVLYFRPDSLLSFFPAVQFIFLFTFIKPRLFYSPSKTKPNWLASRWYSRYVKWCVIHCILYCFFNVFPKPTYRSRYMSVKTYQAANESRIKKQKECIDELR